MHRPPLVPLRLGQSVRPRPDQLLPARLGLGARARIRLRLPGALAVGLLLAVLGAFALPAMPAQAASSDDVSWGVAPTDNTIGAGRPNFSYTLGGGTQITDGVRISNESAQVITLKVYAADGFTTSTGAIDLNKPEQKSVDVGAWISLDQASVTLQPHRSTVVGFTLTVPGNASPGDHTGGIVTSLVTSTGDGTLSLDRRLGSRVLLRVPGTVRPALTLGAVKVAFAPPANPFGGGTATVSYTISNTGNVRLSAAQELVVSGPFGILPRKATQANLPELLPGATLTRTVTVDGVLATGRLTAEATLRPYSDSGSEPVAVPAASARASVWVMPWGLLIVVVALALAVLLTIVLRRRAGRHRSTSTDARDAGTSGTGTSGTGTTSTDAAAADPRETASERASQKA